MEAFNPIMSQINKNLRFDPEINEKADRIYYEAKLENDYNVYNDNCKQIGYEVNLNFVNKSKEKENYATFKADNNKDKDVNMQSLTNLKNCNKTYSERSNKNDENEREDSKRDDIFLHNPSTINNMLNLFSLKDKKKIAEEIRQSKVGSKSAVKYRLDDKANLSSSNTNPLYKENRSERRLLTGCSKKSEIDKSIVERLSFNDNNLYRENNLNFSS